MGLCSVWKAATVFHMEHNTEFESMITGLVREAISTSGLSQNAVSQNAGIAQATLHRKMHGGGSWTVGELRRIASVTGRLTVDLIPREKRGA